MIVRRPSPAPRPVVVSGRHPYEIFMLILCLLTGIPTMMGVTPTPGSMESQVTPWVSCTWAFFLTFGAATALLGVIWPQPKDKELMSVTALSLEQIGLSAVGGAAIFYGAAIYSSTGIKALVPLGMIMSFGAASIWRAWQLQRLLQGAPHLIRDKRRR